jgi:hypothetical protein
MRKAVDHRRKLIFKAGRDIAIHVTDLKKA